MIRLKWIFRPYTLAFYRAGEEPQPRFWVDIDRRITPDELDDFELRLLANLQGKPLDPADVVRLLT